MNFWFTSDTHFGHANIIKYAKRPFSSVQEMDRTLVQNWNELVRDDDHVYHLGDFACGTSPAYVGRILEQLSGRKHLVLGNHDKAIRRSDALREHFVWVRDVAEITLDKQPITLHHYAMRVWNKSHYGAWQLYGHSHGNLPEEPHLLAMDVGVDPRGMKPISFNEIKAHMETKTWRPIDHHGKTGRD